MLEYRLGAGRLHWSLLRRTSGTNRPRPIRRIGARSRDLSWICTYTEAVEELQRIDEEAKQKAAEKLERAEVNVTRAAEKRVREGLQVLKKKARARTKDEHDLVVAKWIENGRIGKRPDCIHRKDVYAEVERIFRSTPQHPDE